MWPILRNERKIVHYKYIIFNTIHNNHKKTLFAPYMVSDFGFWEVPMTNNGWKNKIKIKNVYQVALYIWPRSHSLLHEGESNRYYKIVY